MPLTPFDFIASVSTSKQDLMPDDVAEKAYNAFLVNHGLSYFPDTVLFANEMNLNAALPKRMQYLFLLETLKPRKRWSKWHKREVDDDLQAVKDYYKCSWSKAREISRILTSDQIDELRARMFTGGRSKP
jgi:hypothetical protein